MMKKIELECNGKNVQAFGTTWLILYFKSLQTFSIVLNFR